jgi:hypothetical protein
MLTESLLKIHFSVIGQCSLVPTSHWVQGKSTRINLSQAASGMIYQNHSQLPVCILTPQKKHFWLFLGSKDSDLQHSLLFAERFVFIFSLVKLLKLFNKT